MQARAQEIGILNAVQLKYNFHVLNVSMKHYQVDFSKHNGNSNNILKLQVINYNDNTFFHFKLVICEIGPLQQDTVGL